MHKAIPILFVAVLGVIVAAAITAGVNLATLEDTYMGIGVVIDKMHTPASVVSGYDPNLNMPTSSHVAAKYEVFVEIAGKCITANAETAVEWARYSKDQEVFVTERAGWLGHYDYTVVPK